MSSMIGRRGMLLRIGDLVGLDITHILETDKKRAKSLASTTSLTEATAHAIMFGLLLYSIILMISKPQITGFTILELPVAVNLPLVVGLILFIVDIVIIERWFRKS